MGRRHAVRGQAAAASYQGGTGDNGDGPCHRGGTERRHCGHAHLVCRAVRLGTV